MGVDGSYPMYEATFRLAGTSAYADATAETDARIELWCSDHCDLLHVTSESPETVLTVVRESVGVNETLEREGELVVVTNDCLREHVSATVEPTLAHNGCLLLPPLRYERGTKRCRILALTARALTDCYRDLVGSGVSVTVESKREIEYVSEQSPLLTLEGLLPTLTARQREALQIAYESGYYRIPRETTTAEIADVIGVNRRTAEEHLRRAENKLLGALVEYGSV